MSAGALRERIISVVYFFITVLGEKTRGILGGSQQNDNVLFGQSGNIGGRRPFGVRVRPSPPTRTPSPSTEKTK